MVENTCKWETCASRRKAKLKKPEECPNYLENIFITKENKKLVIVDCAPVRTALMLQEFYIQFMGLQKAVEQQRNQIAGLLSFMNSALEHAKRKQVPSNTGEIIDVTPEEATEGEPTA